MPDVDPPPLPRRYLLPAFAVVAFALIFPYPSRLNTYVVGDQGDAFFTVWAMRWDASRFGHFFSGLWSAPIFYPAHNTLAYSESFYPLAPVMWLGEKLTHSPVLIDNLMVLALWTLAPWWAYRLALRLTRHHAASIVAGLAWAYATIRMSQVGHFQLATAALLPLAILLTLQLFDRPRRRDAIALGAIIGFLFATTSYYALELVIVLALAAVIHLVATRARHVRALAVHAGIAAVIALVIGGPAVWHFRELQRDPLFRRGYAAGYTVHPGDLRVVPSGNRLYRALDVLQNHSATRTGENYAWPGVVVVVFAIVAIVVLVRRRQRVSRPRELLIVGSIGLLALLLALPHRAKGIPTPSLLAAHVIPGFSGMRAIVRFLVFFELGLAMLAAVGLAWFLARFGSRLALVLAVILGALVLIEAAQDTQLARVPLDGTSTAVAQVLRTKAPGPVVELPVGSDQDGSAHAYIEAPRMVAATIDWHPRVNGYSGFVAPGYDQRAAILESFPSQESLDLLDTLGVRYVVVRTHAVGQFGKVIADRLSPPGVAGYSADDAAARVAAIPSQRLAGVQKVGDDWLVELRPPA